MFDWNGCPPGMFDIYVEVGEVKSCGSDPDGSVSIELWTASCLSPRSSLSECASPVRRPVYGVLKQIRKLSEGMPVSLSVMCNGVTCDTVDQSVALALLIKQLKSEGLLKETVIYTGYSKARLEERIQTSKWRRSSDRELFLSLYELTDTVVFEKANRYSKNG